jgi:hypothetical protein
MLKSFKNVVQHQNVQWIKQSHFFGCCAGVVLNPAPDIMFSLCQDAGVGSCV